MQAKRYSPKSFDGDIPAALRCPTEKEGAVPDTTITIDRDQRAGIYELVCNHLYGIDDLWTALGRSRDYATAERLGMEFGEDFRLLNDIGWAPDDGRESFELTMPTHDLMELFKRLRGEAEEVLGGSRSEREAAEDDARTNERFQTGRDACESLLADLDPRTGEPT